MENKPVSVKSFIKETEVDKIVEEIRQELIKRNGGSMPVFSDLIKVEDGKEYQYVNYVQEGGGVLGVGLVGYTYVLEKLGIRFLKLAGTSAGAINTMMLAVVDKKNYKDAEDETGEKFPYQSEIILYEMLKKDLWEMVDGAGFAKFLVKMFLNRKSFFRNVFRIIKWAIYISVLAVLLLGIFKIVDTLNFNTNALYTISKAVAILGLISAGVLLVFFLLVKYYIGRFVKSGYGVNPGRDFKEWITEIINRNGIKTSADLEQKMSEKCCNLSLRPERINENIEGDNSIIAPPYLSIIASEITNQQKVDFPAMAKYYWQDEKNVDPADFVRASMSIPIFFEPFSVKVTAYPKDEEGKLLLQNIPPDVSPDNPVDVRFVDGGILSNFPINVFHNPQIMIARMPTFGVKLEDEEHELPGDKEQDRKSLFSFLGSIFSTVRFYYDRDFLLKNQIYEKCIGHIDVADFNWLNFSVSDEDKKKLFVRGAEAARTFFLGGDVWVDGKPRKFEAFDWQAFKVERTKVIKTVTTSLKTAQTLKSVPKKGGPVKEQDLNDILIP